MTKVEAKKAVVVGAGPVGCLAALALAKAGWRVEVYEGRSDPRLESSNANANQRSINLAISSRGLCAIQAIDPDIATRFLDSALPMKGRMIHTRDGQQQSQLYDIHGQCINSIDRGVLNQGLLQEVTNASIPVFFQHKLQAVDFDGQRMTLSAGGAAETHQIEVDFDFCVGADGSYSNVRRQLMRVVRMDYQQEYIPHEYLELRIPPQIGVDGSPEFALDPGHLHIWPRHSFMLIALPNKDRSFTVTLFAPSSEFAKFANSLPVPSSTQQVQNTGGHNSGQNGEINDGVGGILHWFRTEFADALDLIGEDNLMTSFRNNPVSPLMCVKARPYHYKDRVIILGDAAHSMVPFYGQGLNCGLEDVRVLDVLFRKFGVSPLNNKEALDDIKSGSNGSRERSRESVDYRLAAALQEYSETRHDDLVAISDLAMRNYVEMRHSVTTLGYRFRKTLDGLLSRGAGYIPFDVIAKLLADKTFVHEREAVGSGWLPLYTMVTFRPDISYSAVLKKSRRQDEILGRLGWVSSVGLGVLALTLSTSLLKLRRL